VIEHVAAGSIVVLRAGSDRSVLGVLVITERDVHKREQEGADERFHAAFLITAASLMVLALWVRPILSSLWVDETGTWWVIEGGVRQVIQRADAVQGQSALYYLLMWAWTHAVGHSEFALRIPSLVFSLTSTWIVYLIARRLFDREVGLLALVTYVAWHQVVFEASNARPYAFATFCVVTAAWLLIIWLDRGGPWRGCLFVALAAVGPYAHPLTVLVLAAMFVYAAARIRDGSSVVSLKAAAVAVISVALLCVPVAFEVLSLSGRRDDWNIPSSVTLSLVLTMVIPTAFVAVALVALLLVGIVRVRVTARPVPAPTRILLAAWLVIPTAVLFGLALFTPVQLLGTRYFLMIAPAGAIIAAMLIRSLNPPQIRRVLVMILVILSVLDLSAGYKVGDVREAMSLVRARADPRSTTLLAFGFRESLQTSWRDDPDRASLLTAPADYYPVSGDVVALPIGSPTYALQWTKDTVLAAAESSDRILAVAETGSAYEPWLLQFFEDRDFTATIVGSTNTYTVYEFTPPAS
jgi:hypothetical protein